MFLRTLAVLLLGLSALLVVGCSPTLYPLYRDYEHASEDHVPLHRIEEALVEAGWELIPPPAPNAVATAERQIRDWVIYRVVVQVEAVPVGSRHVRLFVHPYRIYATGSRSKIPFLKRSIRRRVIYDIDRVFESYNLVAVGTDISRDRVRRR
ncbi:MAG: hypothetical protein OXD43_11145 [Bacteroidetes bacterium]|nr:hypothetical protein [Bacteroidota bacterium]